MDSKIHEIKSYRNRNLIFVDRFDAGEVLGKMLEPEYKKSGDLLVLAIPAGGVPVGLRIREILKTDFDMIIVRKIPIPDNPEAGFGAMTIDGEIFINQELVAYLGLSPVKISKQIDLVRQVLKKRKRFLRKGKPFPRIFGKTVILVDDGLASGYTMMASIDNVRNKGAKKVIVAVPTAPLNTLRIVEPLADAVYCANVKETQVFAVARAYAHWHDLSTKEVTEMIAGDKKTSQQRILD
jgi:predicted phosphoribosyltransferase